MSLEKYDDGKAAFMAEFEKMRPDLVYADTWTTEQKKEAAELLRPTRIKLGMLSSIPMDCQGRDCLYASSVPQLHDGDPPGKPCPVETAAVTQFFWDYVDELNVDVTRMVEASQVRDLVDQEIQQIRSAIVRGQEHFIQENVVGVDDHGNVITKKELHQAIDYDERILKRKERIRNQLLATREARAKAGQSTADGAQVMADIMDEIRRVQLEREKALNLRLNFDDDDFIDAEEVDGED